MIDVAVYTEYWKQTVKDFMAAYHPNIDLTNEQLEQIADRMLNDDYVWGVIDESIEAHVGDVTGKKILDEE